MRLLIEQRADLNFRDSALRSTALHRACIGDNSEGLQILLEANQSSRNAFRLFLPALSASTLNMHMLHILTLDKGAVRSKLQLALLVLVNCLSVCLVV